MGGNIKMDIKEIECGGRGALVELTCHKMGEVSLETEMIVWIEQGAWICWLAEALFNVSRRTLHRVLSGNG